MRILVAEDERDMNQIIVRRLPWEGYSVDACYDGQDALEYHRKIQQADVRRAHKKSPVPRVAD